MASTPLEWVNEMRLENVCYYLISDEKLQLYRDVDDKDMPGRFAQSVYTLKQISNLFPKLFCF